MDPSRLAHRRALFTPTSGRGRWFELHTALALRRFLGAGAPLFGAEASLRVGPVAATGVYAQSRALSTEIGDVQGRVIAAGLDLALACLQVRSIQSCVLAMTELGRGQVVGHASAGSNARGLDAWYASTGLGLAARFSGRWLAIESTTRFGFARGPTASADGINALAFQGAFFALSVGATVQP